MTVSYIIGHRGNLPQRVRNLGIVLNWLKNFKYEVILVEQDSVPKVKYLSEKFNIKYFFAKNEGIYNRSWGLNIGYRNATGDIIVCADNDMVMFPKELQDSLLQCTNEEYKCVSPFQYLFDLSNEQTENIVKTNAFGHTGSYRHGTNLCSGIVAFTRNCFEEMGGWDERLRGWGGEDDAVLIKLNRLGIKHKFIPYNCYHFFHERTKYDTHLHENYNNNLNILNELNTLDATILKEQTSESFKTCGDINKYS
jgi:glycosyltransferase involved in cell wall biosynthesis